MNVSDDDRHEGLAIEVGILLKPTIQLICALIKLLEYRVKPLVN